MERQPSFLTPKSNRITLGIAILALGYPVLYAKVGHLFTGSDDKAIDVIHQLNASYKPWITNYVFWDAPYAEDILFGLQCLLGLGIILWVIYKRNKLQQGAY